MLLQSHSCKAHKQGCLCYCKVTCKDQKQGCLCYCKVTVVNIVNVLLGISPASICTVPTFRNHVSVPSSKAGEIPKRTFTIFKSRRKLEIYNHSCKAHKQGCLCYCKVTLVKLTNKAAYVTAKSLL
jgi:hypothetical protein